MTSICRLNKSTNGEVSTVGRRLSWRHQKIWCDFDGWACRGRERGRGRKAHTRSVFRFVWRKKPREIDYQTTSLKGLRWKSSPRGAGLRRNATALAGISITMWLSCCRWTRAKFLKAPRWSRSAKFFLFVCLFKFMNGVFFTSSRRRRRRQRCCVKPKKPRECIPLHIVRDRMLLQLKIVPFNVDFFFHITSTHRQPEHHIASESELFFFFVFYTWMFFNRSLPLFSY